MRSSSDGSSRLSRDPAAESHADLVRSRRTGSLGRAGSSIARAYDPGRLMCGTGVADQLVSKSSTGATKKMQAATRRRVLQVMSASLPNRAVSPDSFGPAEAIRSA